jgi:sensor histidine kinase regulating citrate/malate metabolism
MKKYTINNFNIKKASVFIFILNIIQISIAILLLMFENDKYRLNLLAFVIILSVLVNNIIVLYDRYSIKNVNNQYDLVKETLKRVENLNNTLRAQRHDFLNHLQVVYGLLEMDEFDDTKDYIEKVFNDIQKVSRFLKTSKPAINALLQAKILKCEKNNIEVKLNVTSPLTNFEIQEWKICRVLGNLMDNAIYALNETEIDKKMYIEISEDVNFYYFIISDNGKMISDNIKDKIFKPGFSTKGKKGEGMGLYIVKDIVESINGSISFESVENNTSFKVSFLKDLKEKKKNLKTSKKSF